MAIGVSEAAAAISARIEERAAALRNKDAHALVAMEAPEMVNYALAPPLSTGRADVPGLTGWLDTWDGQVGYEVTRLTVHAGADTGFAYSLDRMYGVQRGKQTSLWFRLTLGFVRVDDQWLIVHEHASVPFAMDGSDLAQLDLQP
ncbi:ketosteroid isomerase-like protein [Tamaricihabitans halophyticus]|uniref:Ketosteroid isomerase-like protein n=1 Tax=Tamaricihabitans halophyticus TaxID=1262583 RepID=A0A4R2RBX1_9PSEU|nr:nuclear transport factor 2 family protein [Tamaricihabitans halophyticus]TCP57221.1 ketosteroid isomerase-like protein [Tamaricihabitans halophyticus]